MQTTAKVQRNRAAQLNQKMYLKREYELVCSGNTKKKYIWFFFSEAKGHIDWYFKSFETKISIMLQEKSENLCAVVERFWNTLC